MDFYYHPMSPPCRGVMHTIAALGLKVNFKVIDTHKKENMTPEYLAINPQHTIPTLVDGDFKIWESRAISTYLVNQHGKDDSLYPKDPLKRAYVDRSLYFDMGTLYLTFMKYAGPIIMRGEKADPDKLQVFEAALEILEKGLSKHQYTAGDSITVADHFILGTVAAVQTGATMGLNIKMESYPSILAWFARAKAGVPGYDKIEKEVNEAFAAFVANKAAA